jgi:hypothetical protein
VVIVVPVFRALLPTLSRNFGVQVHLQIRKVVALGPTLGLLQQGGRTRLPGEGTRGPSSWTECKIPDEPQIVGIKDPPLPKTDTQETESLKAISFAQKGTSMYILQLSRHLSTKWPTVAPPCISDVVVPAPKPGFVQVKGSQSPLID